MASELMIERRLASIETDVAECLRLLRVLIQGDVLIMTTQADLDTKIAALNAKLTQETNAERAVISLLGSVTTDLAAVRAQLAAANPSLDLSGLDALGATIDGNAAAAAAAVVAGTPAAPAPAAAPTAPSSP